MGGIIDYFERHWSRTQENPKTIGLTYIYNKNMRRFGELPFSYSRGIPSQAVPQSHPEPKKAEYKFVPTEETVQTIVDYFASNSFQDFNTWLQVSHSHFTEQFSEEKSRNTVYKCTSNLFFQNPQLPMLNSIGEGRNKKEARRQALQRMIEQLAWKGHIVLGFKDENFMQKLPRRKRPEQPAQEQSQQQNTQNINTIRKKLEKNEFASAIEILCTNIFNRKSLDSHQVSSLWIHALNCRNQHMISKILQVLMAPKHVQETVISTMNVPNELKPINDILQKHYTVRRLPNQNRYESFDVINIRLFDQDFRIGREEAQKDAIALQNALMNDLTYELKQFTNYQIILIQTAQPTLPMKYACHFEPQIVYTPMLPIVPVILMEPGRVSIPSRVQCDGMMGIYEVFKQEHNQLLQAGISILRSNFDRIELRKQADLRLVDRKVSQNMQKIPKFEVPRFREMQDSLSVLPVSNRILDVLYESTLYSLQRHFSLEMCEEIYSKIRIRLDQPVSLTNILVNNTDASYYAHRKNIHFIEFIEEIHDRIKNIKEGAATTTLEGLLMPLKNNDQMFNFTIKQNEPESKISKKTNTNEFQEMQKIASGQMGLLIEVHDQDNMHICCLKEVNPPKIYCPTLKITQATFFRFVKILNRKVFDRVSNAISNVSRKNMAVMNQNNMHLVMMYPGTGINMVVQMVLQWIKGGHSILIAAIDIDETYRVLVAAGLNCYKIANNTDEKMLVATKAQVVCSNIQACASDCFKNQIYTRVLILQANSISQNLTLLALGKGCRKAVLVGDQQLPGPRVKSMLSRSKGGSVSLFQRLLRQGHSLSTYNENSVLDPSIVSFISPTFYQGRLKIAQKLNIYPKIKGFPWPSHDIRLCVVHQPSQSYRESAIMAIRIWASVLQAGFTDIKQMTIAASQYPQYLHLRFLLAYYLQLRHNITKEEWSPEIVNSVCCLPSEQQAIIKDFIVLSTTNTLHEKDLLSFMSRVRKGIVIVADLNKIDKTSIAWHNLLLWANQYRLILQSDGAYNSNC